MATIPALLPIEKYLNRSYHPDVDFVDGEIEKRNLGEFDHARLQTSLAALCFSNESLWQVQTVTEQRIRVSPTRVRIADIALLDANAPRERVTETPPLLCIEILSRRDRISRTLPRLADYLAMGVQNLWLVDPLRRAAYTFDHHGLHHADVTRLNIANTPLLVDLTAPFAALD